jgi:hypothetical protein
MSPEQVNQMHSAGINFRNFKTSRQRSTKPPTQRIPAALSPLPKNMWVKNMWNYAFTHYTTESRGDNYVQGSFTCIRQIQTLCQKFSVILDAGNFASASVHALWEMTQTAI